MSGSEAVMTTREPFTMSPPAPANSSFSPDGTSVFQPMSGSPSPYQLGVDGSVVGGGGVINPQPISINMGEPLKRKRGRPRKYGPEGSMSLNLTSIQSPTVTVTPPGGTFSSPPPPPSTTAPPPPSVGTAAPSSFKKVRGRPRGSKNKKLKQKEAWGSEGSGFTPHVVNVNSGEEISSRIMALCHQGPRAIVVLSANGSISNVTIRQPATSGGSATYEGRYEILSLSGSFLPLDIGGQRSRTGGLSIALAGPDGKMLGGCVSGYLTAASPVQIIAASFMAGGRKDTKSNHSDPSSAPTKTNPAFATGVSSSPSRGTLSESSGGPGSPLNLSTGACNNHHPQGISNMQWK